MPELDLGNVKGPQGKSAYQSALDAGYSGSEEAFNTAMAKAPDAVLYTVQSLTDAQKAQARGNINAAPGGFGLGGGSKVLTPDDDLNNIWEDGSYAWDGAPKNAPTVGGSLIPYCSMQVINKGSSYNMHQIARTFEGYEIRRYYDGAKKTWSEWAWVNPPMMLGVEYRTTEYYLGKPVYVKVVAGSFSGAGVTSISHGIANIDKCVAATGIALQIDSSSSYNFSFPYWFTNGSTLAQGISVSINSSAIALNSVTDYSSSYSVQVTIKYTKTTD